MKCATVTRALIVRLCFASHGLISIYLLYSCTGSYTQWYLATALAGLFFETMVTLIRKHGHEWKWFCPSVFFYLSSVVPSIWFFEMELFDFRAKVNDKRVNSTIKMEMLMNSEKYQKCSYYTSLEWKNNPFLVEDFGVTEKYVRISEQLLLLLLILGRWFLPKGKLSHDQLSQLLLVYLGTAADIAEFFEAFKEKTVQNNRILCLFILGLWSWSLLQFSFVLTAARARKDQSGILSGRNQSSNSYNKYYQPDNIPYLSVFSIKEKQNKSLFSSCCKFSCFSADVYGIFISISLQDGPFLAFRLALIFKFHVVSYTNMFFTAKNSLVIILLVYRLIVIWCEQKKKAEIQEENENTKTQVVLKRIDRGFQNGFIGNDSLNNKENLIFNSKNENYSCSDIRNQTGIKSTKLDLEAGLLLKSGLQNNLFTIPLRDEREFLSNDLTKNNTLQRNSSPVNTNKPINSIKQLETINTCSLNLPDTETSTHLLESTSTKNPLDVYNNSSKIQQDIDAICNDAQNFLQRFHSKSCNDNLNTSS